MIHFVAPPGWPSGPEGWLPPIGWTPAPDLPDPPRGWVFYVDDYGMPADPGPYQWDPDDVASESFSTASPVQTSHHRSVVTAGMPHRVRVVVVLATALVAVVAMRLVLVARPGLLDDLKDAMTTSQPSESAGAQGDIPWPEPNDPTTAALTALGHRCITEAVEPHLIGCTARNGDVELTTRWVLDAEGEIITFQVRGQGTGPGGPTSTAVAVLLQLATGDPRVEIISALPGFAVGDEQDFALDWGSVHIGGLDDHGRQLVQGVRADGPPPPMAPRRFVVSASEARAVLPADGDFECSGKDTPLTCTRGDGEIAIRSADDTITAVLIGVEHIDDTKGPLLNLILAEDDILPVVEAVLQVADREPGTVVAVAGHRVERVEAQVRIVRILPWW